MEHVFETAMAGHFTLRVVGGARDGEVLAEFDNLITDAGLNWLFTGSGLAVNECALGSSNATPAVGDLALGSQTASTTTVQVNFAGSDTLVAGPPLYAENSRTFRLAAQGVNRTYSEVGIFTASPRTLFSRALILDGGGSPTSITVLLDESLDITYRVRRYAPTADATGTITLESTSFSWALRAASFGAFGSYYGWSVTAGLNAPLASSSGRTASTYTSFAANRALQAATASPNTGSGEVASYMTVTPVAYTANSLQQTVEIKWDLADLNLGGGSFTYLGFYAPFNSVGTGQHSSAWQMTFSPAVPKTNTKVLRLNFTFSLTRYTP